MSLFLRGKQRKVKSAHIFMASHVLHIITELNVGPPPHSRVVNDLRGPFLQESSVPPCLHCTLTHRPKSNVSAFNCRFVNIYLPKRVLIRCATPTNCHFNSWNLFVCPNITNVTTQLPHNAVK